MQQTARRRIVISKRKNNGEELPTRRYSAKLLFQYRVMVGGSAGIRRLCEERVITFSSSYGRAALREAQRRGRAVQHSWTNNAGNHVHFEFVGVMELICVESVCEADEVWYELSERVRPMERRGTFIPPESRLHAIRNNE
jgi:hypothetical protein